MNNRQIVSSEPKGTQRAQVALHGESSRADGSHYVPQHYVSQDHVSQNHAPQNHVPQHRDLQRNAPQNNDPQNRDFWEAFTFSDGFEEAFYQDAPVALASGGLINVLPPLPSEEPDSPQPVTPSQWQPLQYELIEAMDNLCAPPFSFSLQLPTLGDIDARLATLVPRGWDISLRFSRESYHQLKDRREACRRSIATALDCPINLRFDAREYER